MDTSKSFFNACFYKRPVYGTLPIPIYTIAKNSKTLLQRMSLERKLKVHLGCVNTICWNSTGQYILSASDDQHLCVTHAFTGKLQARIRTGHLTNIFSAKFMPDTQDSKVVSCSGDGIIIYTDLNRPDSAEQNIFDCQSESVYDIITVPNDSHTFLTCSHDRTVRWYDLRIKNSCCTNGPFSHFRIRTFQKCRDDVLIRCENPVTALAINHLQPHQLAVGCSDSIVRIYDRRMLSTKALGGYQADQDSRSLLYSFTYARMAKKNRITSLAYSGNGQRLLVSYSNDNLYMFEMSEVKSTANNALESDVLVGGSNAAESCPFKRFRLRGDWSDTGPSALMRNAEQELQSPPPTRRNRVPISRTASNSNVLSEALPPPSATTTAAAAQPTATTSRGSSLFSLVAASLQTSDPARSPTSTNFSTSPQASSSSSGGSMASSSAASSTAAAGGQRSSTSTELNPQSSAPDWAPFDNYLRSQFEDRADSPSLVDQEEDPEEYRPATRSNNLLPRVVSDDEWDLDSESTSDSVFFPWYRPPSSNDQAAAAASSSATSATATASTSYPTTPPPPIDVDQASSSATAGSDNDNGPAMPNVFLSRRRPPNNPLPDRLPPNYHPAEFFFTGPILDDFSASGRPPGTGPRIYQTVYNPYDSPPTKNTKTPKLQTYKIQNYKVFKGHRNSRTVIKEATFWGDDYVVSGSDCGHIFFWSIETGELVMLIEGDNHVVNCLQPHPTLPVLASSGIDYDVKIWSPQGEESKFDPKKANTVTNRNAILMADARETVTVPARFVLSLFSTMRNNRATAAGNNNERAEGAGPAAAAAESPTPESVRDHILSMASNLYNNRPS